MQHNATHGNMLVIATIPWFAHQSSCECLLQKIYGCFFIFFSAHIRTFLTQNHWRELYTLNPQTPHYQTLRPLNLLFRPTCEKMKQTEHGVFSGENNWRDVDMVGYVSLLLFLSLHGSERTKCVMHPSMGPPLLTDPMRNLKGGVCHISGMG